jgi:hypothetical protein
MGPPQPVEGVETDKMEDGGGTAAGKYNHTRNKTGIVGVNSKRWSNDPQINALWVKLTEPLKSDVGDLQKSMVYHLVYTFARAYFNIDASAAYQAAAHS